MRVAVLADIHSNYLALEACIKYAENQRIDKLLFLGDYLGECGQPEKTMDIIFRLKEKYECYFVKGNKEEAWLWYINNGPKDLLNIEYDVDRTVNLLHKERLNEYAPYWCQVTEMLLRTGEISHGKVLRSVMELCREETGECIWPYIPEKYWEPVLQEVTKELEENVKDGK